MNQIISGYKKIESLAFNYIPRGHWFILAALATCLLVIGTLSFLNNNDDATTATDNPEFSSLETEALSDPTLNTDPSSTVTPLEVPNVNEILHISNAADAKLKLSQTIEITVKSGDKLSNLFTRAGLSDRDLYEVFDGNKKAQELRSIKAGQKITFKINPQGKLAELTYSRNMLESLKITRNVVGFSTQEIELKPEVRRVFRQGTINSSLFAAGKQSGLPINLVMELANIFAWDVDFAQEIRKGDSFKVMYEEHYLEGKKIGTGVILAAEFVNSGKTYQAVRYTNKEGSTRYYTPDGKGMNKAFLRMPVDFARISSGFSLGRLHPVLNTIRAHKGVDYAAATGTPIRATGDGRVTFAGRQGGFGNCIVIQHGQGYETLYGHMSAFAKGISTGSKVSQGQYIGYVGMTGLATGPHLHYEFHVNGQVRDPVTVQLPQATGIAANEKERFTATTQTLVAQLQDLDRANRLALTDSKTKTN